MKTKYLYLIRKYQHVLKNHIYNEDHPHETVEEAFHNFHFYIYFMHLIKLVLPPKQ